MTPSRSDDAPSTETLERSHAEPGSAPDPREPSAPPGTTRTPGADAGRTDAPRAYGRRRVAVEGVEPEIDGGRFPAKRVAGEDVVVEADAFADGHDAVRCALLYRREEGESWSETPMEPLGNDRWRGSFPAQALGRYRFTILAWVDHFESWRRDLVKRVEAGQDVDQELEVGARLLESAAGRAGAPDDAHLLEGADLLRAARGETATAAREEPAADAGEEPPARIDDVIAALEGDLGTIAARHPDRRFATRYARELPVEVERVRARFSAWYEFFPRSAATKTGEHGTFEDCTRLLPYIKEMGFDVVYLPPIHPIGRTKRKGPNNAPEADPGDPGSPWAIGAAEGGHTAVHPDLGDLDDFREFRERAESLGMEVALDLAFQCAPDHPWVEEHPEWFEHRPDGSIRYAENPPKKYEDIYPLDFESEDWRGLWSALEDVVEFWIEQGVEIFRVDNPHTKSLPFWEWLIDRVRDRHPRVIFLSEAFARPRMMYRLAKLGFSQSYTYFTWRNEKWELEEYLTELTRTEVREYFRPNFWPNTPDILHEYLQTGGRPAFVARMVLAATMTASWGIYGPTFELCEATPREAGSEEYLDSEKFQIREWDLDQPHSLKELIGRVNRIRQGNPALHRNESLRFHPTDNDALLAYSKRSPGGRNTVLVVVNLDPHHTRAGWVDLDLQALGVDPEEGFQVHDLLGDARYLWRGSRNYVELDPGVLPAHVFRVRQRTRDETDFDYYM